MPCTMVELLDWDPSVTRHTCSRLSCKVHNLTLPASTYHILSSREPVMLRRSNIGAAGVA